VLRDHVSRSGGAFVKWNVLGVAKGNIAGKSILAKYKFITKQERRVEQNK
jgi:hypothetical protein